jgi:hypothetical protein
MGLNEDAIDDLDIDSFFPVADSFEHGCTIAPSWFLSSSSRSICAI